MGRKAAETSAPSAGGDGVRFQLHRGCGRPQRATENAHLLADAKELFPAERFAEFQKRMNTRAEVRGRDGRSGQEAGEEDQSGRRETRR